MALKASIGDDADFQSTRAGRSHTDSSGVTRRDAYDFRGDVQTVRMQQQPPRNDLAQQQQML